MTESQVFDEILMAWHIRHLLDTAGAPTIYSDIGITCVDPLYPADSLGEQYAGVDYSETRFQRASSSHFQVSITYDGARNFHRISQDEVEKNLENGVLQMAFKRGTPGAHRGSVVIGIPGDAGAFNRAGVGPGMGTRNGPSAIAYAAVRALAIHSLRPLSEIKIDLMSHPDCVWMAANYLAQEDVRALEKGHEMPKKAGTYMGSEYQQQESKFKSHGAESLAHFTHQNSLSQPLEITPVYEWRFPNILDQLKDRHDVVKGIQQIKAGNIEDLEEEVLHAFENPLEHPAIIV
jgi:hypothetical protein